MNGSVLAEMIWTMHDCPTIFLAVKRRVTDGVFEILKFLWIDKQENASIKRILFWNGSPNRAKGC